MDCDCKASGSIRFGTPCGIKIKIFIFTVSESGEILAVFGFRIGGPAVENIAITNRNIGSKSYGFACFFGLGRRCAVTAVCIIIDGIVFCTSGGEIEVLAVILNSAENEVKHTAVIRSGVENCSEFVCHIVPHKDVIGASLIKSGCVFGSMADIFSVFIIEIAADFGYVACGFVGNISSYRNAGIIFADEIIFMGSIERPVYGNFSGGAAVTGCIIIDIINLIPGTAYDIMVAVRVVIDGGSVPVVA